MVAMAVRIAGRGQKSSFAEHALAPRNRGHTTSRPAPGSALPWHKSLSRSAEMQLTALVLVSATSAVAVAPPVASSPHPTFGRIALRDSTVAPVPVAECLDSAGASNESPIKTSACSEQKGSQLFSYRKNQHLQLNGTSCAGSSAPCCVENWNGEATIFSCSDMPSIKAWAYSNTTGHISNSGQCMTATGGGGKVTVASCKQDDPNQMWRVEAAASGPAPPAPPPGSSKCSVIGCPSDWTPGLPCQCNPDCERYGNCCADKEQVCGKAPPSPSPGPWPCRWPPCPGPPAPSCGHVAGKWSAAAAGDVVTITQSGCNLVATDPRQPWSPAQGTGQAWNLQMTFGGVSLSGHLQGCSPSGCPQGSTISFSNGQRWTRQ